jgi:uncharacterized protein
MAAESVKPLSWGQPTAHLLKGDRLHLQHGPIDLIIKAEGDGLAVKQAYAAAVERFQTVLSELAAELSELRKPLSLEKPMVRSSISKRMVAACWPYRDYFITPMAAVAGSVSDEMKSVMLETSPALKSLYINNGGDIAVHVAKGAILKIGMVTDLAKATAEGMITVNHDAKIGGIATSGWRGRSFSRGVADAVTVLAQSASEADAAATIIANAVDVNSPAIERAPAQSLDPDSDLGNILVTIAVHHLTRDDIATAFKAGERVAATLQRTKLIQAYVIALQGQICLSEEAQKLISV